MDLYDQNFITRVIFTIASIAIAVGPTIADFNKTHDTHPDWPGHARFHVVWQVLGFYPSAIIALIILWSRIPDFHYPYQLYIWMIYFFGFYGTFLITLFSMKIFDGTLSDKGGRIPFTFTFDRSSSLRLKGKNKVFPFNLFGQARMIKVDENLFNVTTMALIVILTIIFVMKV